MNPRRKPTPVRLTWPLNETTASTLTPDVHAALAAWTPAAAAPAHIIDWSRAAAAGLRPGSASTATRYARAILRHATRLHDLGIDPTTGNEAFETTHIEATIASTLAQLPASTRANETSALRKAARTLGGTAAAVAGGAGRPTSSTPYAPHQAQQLLIAALHLPSARRRKELTCMVTLSLGAGLHTQEICALTAGDITFNADSILVPTGIGAIPVLNAYAGALREVLTDQPATAPLIDNTSDVGVGAMNAYGISHGMTGWNIWRAVATWRTHQLSRVPLPVLARGLRLSARYLSGLLEHCPEVTDEQLLALRDADSA